MARPKKVDEAKRNFMLRVRFTQTEKQTLFDRAGDAGCTVSDFVRVKALADASRTVKTTGERAAFIRALAEIHKIGSNVNQIARALNRRALTGRGDAVPTEQISNTLYGVDLLARELRNLLEHGH